jgi:hypothetical protein
MGNRRGIRLGLSASQNDPAIAVKGLTLAAARPITGFVALFPYQCIVCTGEANTAA